MLYRYSPPVVWLLTKGLIFQFKQFQMESMNNSLIIVLQDHLFTCYLLLILKKYCLHSIKGGDI